MMMPLTHRVEHGFLRVTFHGHVLPEKQPATFLEALEAAEFVDGMNVLLDLSEWDAGQTQSEITGMARFLGELRGRIGPRCAVTVSSPVQYGLARMLAAYAEPYDLKINVFGDRGQARRWLDEGAAAAPG